MSYLLKVIAMNTVPKQFELYSLLLTCQQYIHRCGSNSKVYTQRKRLYYFQVPIG